MRPGQPRDRISPADRAVAPIIGTPAVYAIAAATIAALGANWPIMSRGVDLVPALWLAGLRLLGSAVLVAAVMAATRGLRPPRRSDIPILLTVGLVRLALVYGLVFLALRFVPPGRSSILVYTASLWAVPMAIVVLRERLTGLRVAGLALGVGGLALLVEPWALGGSDGDLRIGIGMLLGAAVATAASTIHIRKHRWTDTPWTLMPWLLGLASVPVVGLAWLTEGPPDFAWTAPALAVVAYQIVIASAFGFWGSLTLNRSLSAITTNLTFMAVPVVGLVSSIVFVDERANASVVLGMVLVLAGVALGLLSDRAREETIGAPP